MTDDVTHAATTAIGRRRRSAQWYAVPAAVLLVGLVSIAMLFWTSALNKQQMANFALADTFEHLQTRTALTHLWVEEALTEKQDDNFKAAWANMAEVKRLSEAILLGGKTRYNMPLHLPQDQNFTTQAEKVRGLLSKFEALAEQRFAHPETSGIGSELDTRFDNLFKEIQYSVSDLRDGAEKTLRSDNVKMTRIFFAIVIVWSLIIAAATTGLWRHETKRRWAGEALQNAKDELEVRVAERTRELQVTNEQLSLELTARRQAEAENADLQKEAERAAHLAALGELAAGVAHEINNPVSGIISCAEILANKTALGSREHDLGRRILKEGDRIAFIVQSLLSFAREEPGEKVPVQVREILADVLALTEALRGTLPHTLYVQGDAPRAHLLRAFREGEDTVLIGTGTFWEGVDVPGASLRCVVIDKLPFASPSDPVTSARIRVLRDRGADPFKEYQLPEAVLALRQGVGRLLRRGDDYGVVALLDRRVSTRGYGGLFRANLPPARWTDDRAEVAAFFLRFHGEKEKEAKK